jgi:hypothetical protein
MIRDAHEVEDGHAFDRVTGLCAHCLLSKRKYQNEQKPRCESQSSEQLAPTGQLELQIL